MRTLALLALLCCLCGARGASAWELWRRGETVLELGGYARQIGLFTHGTDSEDFVDTVVANPLQCGLAATLANCPAFEEVGDRQVFESLTRLRAELSGRLNRHWSALVVYDQEVLAGDLDTLESGISEGLSTESFLGAEGVIAGSEQAGVIYRHRLYRGFLRFESDHFDVRVGRQRIAWGVGRLWKPLDRFQFVPPLAIEADQIPGIDAVDARWLISGFTFLEAALAPTSDFEDSAYAGRLHGVLRDIDYSVVGGVFEEAWTLGFDLAGNILEAAARLEFAYSHPKRSVWPIGDPKPSRLDPYFQVVGSIDHLFDVGTGVYVLLEHLYNGNALGFGYGEAGPLLPFFESTLAPPAGTPPGVSGPFWTTASTAIFGGSRVVTRSANLTGLSFAYDITPEVRGELLTIYDWTGTSVAFFPRILYTPLDWLEVSVAGQIFAGRRLSEFGSAENLAFFLLEAFF